MRLIPSDECARVYSGLGLSRAFARGGAMAGCGAGAGFSSERLDPRMVPGCVLMACTDTTAEPNAVVFSPPTWTDADMEAANVTSWSAYGAGTTRTKEAGAYAGTQCLRITSGGAAFGSQPVSTCALPAGNTVRVRGKMRGDGTRVPKLYDWANGVLYWTGTGANGWQDADTGWFVPVVNGSVMFYCSSTTGYIEADAFTVETLNASQFTDLSGAGHHLVQATAASQLLWTASGAGGYLSSDGVADRMNVAYASNQPRTRYCLARVVVQASARTLFDGATADTGALKHKAGSTTTQCNAGSAFDGPALTDATWMFYAQVLNGAASAVSINGGAFTVGDAGAGNPGGVYLGCGGAAAAGTFAVARYAMFLDYDGAHDINQVRRMYRYSQRLAARLAI
jgi:hypothetical protein